MESTIFSKSEIEVKAYDVEDGSVALTMRTENGEKFTLFASIGAVYRMAQAIENVLDDLDISPCSECDNYRPIVQIDDSGHYCEECRDAYVTSQGGWRYNEPLSELGSIARNLYR